MGGLLGRRGDLWGTIYKLLYAFLKLGQMLKGLYRFKPPDLAPKRALLGAIFTDFEKFGHGGGLRSRADPVVPSGTFGRARLIPVA